MDVYGLTGGIGTGKSTVAALLEEYGIPVVSADELSRVVVARGSEGLRSVVDRFGPEILTEHKELDRGKMAELVFSDPSQRHELEAILHPLIRERFEQVLDALEKAGHEVAIYEVPLLFEKNLQYEMKATVLVTADEAVRIHRVIARDHTTEAAVRARIATQMDESLKRRKADYVIENNGSLDDLRREVEFLLGRFLRVGHGSSLAPLSSNAPASPSPNLPTPVPSEPRAEPSPSGPHDGLQLPSSEALPRVEDGEERH